LNFVFGWNRITFTHLLRQHSLI